MYVINYVSVPATLQMAANGSAFEPYFAILAETTMAILWRHRKPGGSNIKTTLKPVMIVIWSVTRNYTAWAVNNVRWNQICRNLNLRRNPRVCSRRPISRASGTRFRELPPNPLINNNRELWWLRLSVSPACSPRVRLRRGFACYLMSINTTL